MISLCQTTGYAILALACVAIGKGRWVLAQEIASFTGIPKPYLSKVLHALVRAGLIEGKRGSHGGFRLRHPTRPCRLVEVALAVEGPNWLPPCILGFSGCGSGQPRCPLHSAWMRTRKRLAGQFERTTLRDLMGYIKRRGPKGLLGLEIPKGKREGEGKGNGRPRPKDGRAKPFRETLETGRTGHA